jgi:hypothetical protein
MYVLWFADSKLPTDLLMVPQKLSSEHLCL